MRKIILIASLLFFTLIATSQYTVDTVFVFQEDTVLTCNMDSLFVDAGEGFDTYLWNTGATSRGIWVFDTETYIVDVDGTGGNQSDSVYINIILVDILQDDTTICYGDTITLSVNRKRSDCLIAYYPFDGNSRDYSGNDYDAFSIGARLVSDRFGNPNSAYSFDGQSNYMLATIEQEVGSMAVSLWFRTPDTMNWYDDNYYPTFFDYGHGEFSTSILGVLPDYISNDEVGNIKVDHIKAPGSPDNFSFQTTEKPEMAEWHHLYAVLDSTDSDNEIWVKGVKMASNSDNALLEPENFLILFGRTDGADKDSSYYLGRLDEISIYNCSFDSAQINAVKETGSIFSYKYYWSTGDTTATIAKIPEETTTYYITITDGINSCIDSVTITVNPEIELDLVQIDIGCPGEEKAKMQAFVSGGSPPYIIEWDEQIVFLQGDTLALGLRDSIDYSIMVTDSMFCRINDNFEVEALPLPTIDFTWEPDPVYIQNPIVDFLSESDSAQLWSWQFGDEALSTEENPTHTYAAVETFEVVLTVTAMNGCIDSLIKPIEIKEVELVIPNVFTPNGDGINDTYVVTDLDKYITNYFVVYNRYGKVVFEKNEYQSGDWDGGRLRDGTYYYVLKCTGFYSVDEFKGTINIFTNSN